MGDSFFFLLVEMLAPAFDSVGERRQVLFIDAMEVLLWFCLNFFMFDTAAGLMGLALVFLVKFFNIELQLDDSLLRKLIFRLQPDFFPKPSGVSLTHQRFHAQRRSE